LDKLRRTFFWQGDQLKKKCHLARSIAHDWLC
jgi:hypothetical protein